MLDTATFLKLWLDRKKMITRKILNNFPELDLQNKFELPKKTIS